MFARKCFLDKIQIISDTTKSCAYVYSGHRKWKGVSCDSAYYIFYVCSYSPQARQICKDATSRKYVEVDAQACTNDEFVWHTCPWTCGYCNQVDVPNVTLESNTELVNIESALSVGDVLQYRCKSAYSHVQGDFFRACQRTGVFTGDPPGCQAACTVPWPNNDSPLLEKISIHSV